MVHQQLTCCTLHFGHRAAQPFRTAHRTESCRGATAVLRTWKETPAALRRVTSTDQYSRGLNASIAASRSHTSRSAALCTLPGDTCMHHAQVAAVHHAIDKNQPSTERSANQARWEHNILEAQGRRCAVPLASKSGRPHRG